MKRSLLKSLRHARRMFGIHYHIQQRPLIDCLRMFIGEWRLTYRITSYQ